MGAFHLQASQDQINPLLLPEVLHQVFRLLVPQDLKIAVLVCRLWREVGEAPSLWTWVVLRENRENQSTMVELLERRRMKTVRKIVVEMLSVELLEAVVRHQGLKVMKLEDMDQQTKVDPGLLARAVNRMEKFEMEFSILTPLQVEAILTAIIAGDSCLKKLNISSNNLSKLDPFLLAGAVNRLEKVKMRNSRLSVQHLKAILTVISIGESRLKSLDVRFNNLSTLDTGLLAMTVIRL